MRLRDIFKIHIWWDIARFIDRVCFEFYSFWYYNNIEDDHVLSCWYEMQSTLSKLFYHFGASDENNYRLNIFQRYLSLNRRLPMSILMKKISNVSSGAFVSFYSKISMLSFFFLYASFHNNLIIWNCFDISFLWNQNIQLLANMNSI